MNELLIAIIVYFILGCIAIVFSVWPVGNRFNKFVLKNFDTPNHFNRFLNIVWLYPVLLAALITFALYLFK